jgi:hypothetical protein
MKVKNIIIISIIVIFLFALEIYKITHYEGMEEKNDPTAFSTGLDVQYHADIDRDTYNDITLNVTDPSGNPTTTTISRTLGNLTYYNPGEYKYGSNAYIPNYEDTVYLANVKIDKGPVVYEIDSDQEQNLISLNQKTDLDEILLIETQKYLDGEIIRTSNNQGLFTNAPTNKETNNNSYPGNYVNVVKSNDAISTSEKKVATANITTSSPKTLNVGEFLNDSIYNT